MKQLTAVALLVAVFSASAANARSPYPNPNPHVRFTGILLPAHTQASAGLCTLAVFTSGVNRLLRLDAVENLTTREYDRAVLQDLWRRKVRFYGPEHLMRRLQQSESASELLTIEGRLYPREKRFLISAIEETSKAELQNQREVTSHGQTTARTGKKDNLPLPCL